jgi:hypothetical protein
MATRRSSKFEDIRKRTKEMSMDRATGVKIEM